MMIEVEIAEGYALTSIHFPTRLDPTFRVYIDRLVPQAVWNWRFGAGLTLQAAVDDALAQFHTPRHGDLAGKFSLDLDFLDTL